LFSSLVVEWSTLWAFLAAGVRHSTCTVNGKENKMKDSTKDQVEGKLHEAKGKLKEKAGILTNDPNLQAEGQDEKLGGKIQKKVGQIEKVFEK
jgi:uncharacterized protein YjbJ (UPF0337 family)